VAGRLQAGACAIARRVHPAGWALVLSCTLHQEVRVNLIQELRAVAEKHAKERAMAVQKGKGKPSDDKLFVRQLTRGWRTA